MKIMRKVGRAYRIMGITCFNACAWCAHNSLWADTDGRCAYPCSVTHGNWKFMNPGGVWVKRALHRIEGCRALQKAFGVRDDAYQGITGRRGAFPCS